jgi:hypothetical protein
MRGRITARTHVHTYTHTYTYTQTSATLLLCSHSVYPPCTHTRTHTHKYMCNPTIMCSRGIPTKTVFPVRQEAERVQQLQDNRAQRQLLKLEQKKLQAKRQLLLTKEQRKEEIERGVWCVVCGVCVCMCVYVCVRVCNACVWVLVQVCVCVCVCTSVHVCVNMCICMCVHGIAGRLACVTVLACSVEACFECMHAETCT